MSVLGGMMQSRVAASYAVNAGGAYTVVRSMKEYEDAVERVEGDSWRRRDKAEGDEVAERRVRHGGVGGGVRKGRGHDERVGAVAVEADASGGGGDYVGEWVEVGR